MTKKCPLPIKISQDDWLNYLTKHGDFTGGIFFGDDVQILDVEFPTEQECDERILNVLHYIEDLNDPDVIMAV
jgi:hypothetical protein